MCGLVQGATPALVVLGWAMVGYLIVRPDPTGYEQTYLVFALMPSMFGAGYYAGRDERPMAAFWALGSFALAAWAGVDAGYTSQWFRIAIATLLTVGAVVNFFDFRDAVADAPTREDLFERVTVPLPHPLVLYARRREQGSYAGGPSREVIEAVSLYRSLCEGLHALQDKENAQVLRQWKKAEVACERVAGGIIEQVRKSKDGWLVRRVRAVPPSRRPSHSEPRSWVRMMQSANAEVGPAARDGIVLFFPFNHEFPDVDVATVDDRQGTDKSLVDRLLQAALLYSGYKRYEWPLPPGPLYDEYERTL